MITNDRQQLSYLMLSFSYALCLLGQVFPEFSQEDRIPVEEMIRVRDLVCEDPVALDKWSRIVDHIVLSQPDRLRVRGLLRADPPRYEDAVLQTLNLWAAYGADERANLDKVFRDLKLNALAGNG